MTIHNADGFENYASYLDMMRNIWVEARAGNSTLVLFGGAATGNACLQINSSGFARAELGGIFSAFGVACHFKALEMPQTSTHRQCLLRVHPEVGGGDLLNPPSAYTVKLSPSGRLLLYRGTASGVLIGTSSRPVATGSWAHLEMVLGHEAGTVEVFLNEKSVVKVTGEVWSDCSTFSVGTTDFSNPSNPGRVIQYDDFVTQSAPAGPLGILGAYYQWPIADMAPQDWSLTQGTQAWQLIDEPIPDYDAQYVFTPDVGDTSQFEVTSLPSNVISVAAVMPVALTKKSDLGTCGITLGIKSGASPLEGDDQAVYTNYTYLHETFETDPATEERWSPTDLPALTIKRTS